MKERLTLFFFFPSWSLFCRAFPASQTPIAPSKSTYYDRQSRRKREARTTGATNEVYRRAVSLGVSTIFFFPAEVSPAWSRFAKEARLVDGLILAFKASLYSSQHHLLEREYLLELSRVVVHEG